MAFKARLPYFAWVLLTVSGMSCSTGVDEGGSLDEAGGSSAGGKGNSGSSGTIGRTGGTAGGISVVTATCGDNKWDQGELCDDGNKVNGDCCNEFCKVEADCVCPDPPKVGACMTLTQCGNGLLTSAEACDDGNNDPNDGCSPDCKMVTPGWQCRVPGKKCVPFCGDGQLIGGENCDDMNAVSGDGCSSTCLTEPGWSCMGTPSTCTQSVCGNGMMEAGEGCDLGPAANGLFYGDATGCSKTCTKEPDCRPGGTTQACSTACGDGNVDMADGEVCDDGNAIAGDGCSDTCQLEGGFMCGNMEAPDTVPCPSNAALQCLVLPVIYRDFKGQQEAGGHPDFFFMGATTPAGTPGHVGGKTSCVPNASGTRAPYVAGMACPNTDAVGACPGIAAATLNAMGKPTLAKDTCPCIFTDWDKTGVLTGTASPTCWVEGEAAPNTRDRVDTMVKVVKDAASFAQWYTTSNQSTESRGLLELAAVAGGQYQFSSSVPGAPAGTVGRVVTEDIHANCLGTPTPLQSGFFPLEESTGSAKACNLWPYWKTGLTAANCTATAGNPIVAQWDPLAAWDMCPTLGTGGFVPNASGNGTLAGVARNFYFTTEARYLFRYTAPAPLTFYGDDDVWVFVNGKLALDLGAPHERLQGTVMIDAATYGLEVGRIYEIAVFHADRHPRESNYQLTLSSFATTKSVCEPRCGDEITTLTEECDEGDAATDTDGVVNTDGVYGGCDTQCHFGPFCGDGVVFEGINPATMQRYEQCDKGRDNTAVYGVIGGCSPSCQLTPACGDGIIDSAFGETCDDGPSNGMMGSSCTQACIRVVL